MLKASKLNEEFDYFISSQGYYVLQEAIPKLDVQTLGEDLTSVLNRMANDNNVFGKDLVKSTHFIFDKTENFLSFFDMMPGLELIERRIGETCILHSFSGVSLEPKSSNHASIIHKDSPRFVNGYPLSMQILYMLDDFTPENGGPLVLPGSHNEEKKPTEEQFDSRAVQITGKAGDALIFDSQLWHKGGVNRSNKARRALTLMFNRSFMRQQMDWVRAVDADKITKLSTRGKRLLGMNVRMPTNLEEFNLPLEQRLYQPNQG